MNATGTKGCVFVFVVAAIVAALTATADGQRRLRIVRMLLHSGRPIPLPLGSAAYWHTLFTQEPL